MPFFICRQHSDVHARRAVPHRAVRSFAASAIIGMSLLGPLQLTPPHIALVSIAVAMGVRPGVSVGFGAADVGAAAVGAAAAGAYYAPGYYGAPAPVGCPYGYYYYAPYNRCVPTP